ncbi:MAG: threonine--tRNA ligase [Candidatus Aenigmatarchaeota archaeon]
MKILTIHSDRLEVELKDKAIKDVEKGESGKITEAENALVVFTAVEKGDKKDDETISEKAVDEIEDIFNKVNADEVVIYPYAHLSSNLSSPSTAKEILTEMSELLQEKNIPSKRVAFGWYKRFDLNCKGHPLSELSRELKLGEKEETREDKVSEIESKYYVLTPEGKEMEIDMDDPSSLERIEDENLKTFIKSEEMLGQPKEMPPSIEKMKELELVDYEPASDSGHFRFYPKGTILFDLLKMWADEIALNKLNSVEIDTPILYDWSQPDIREQGGSFHQRHYSVSVPDNENKEFILRFAGDFGLFRIMRDSTLSYKNLPINVYEFSKSFRYEQKGELSGLRRLRAFHMPDIHSFARDIDQGWDVYEDIYKNYNDHAEGADIDFTIAFRVVEDFYEDNKDKIIEMLKYSGKPALIEVLSEMKHYWAVKHEFQGIDSVDGNLQLSTVQLDVEDAERYGITYTNEKNEQEGCIICHSSIGSIERWIYAILEDALKEENPTLPLWLSPIQVRLSPVSDEHIDYCKKLTEKFEKENIRVDIDDRSESVSRKIRDAEKGWIPYTLVIGEKEVNGKTLTVRERKSGKEMEMEFEKFLEKIKEKTKGFPYKPLNLSKLLSKRPKFYG